MSHVLNVFTLINFLYMDYVYSEYPALSNLSN